PRALRRRQAVGARRRRRIHRRPATRRLLPGASRRQGARRLHPLRQGGQALRAGDGARRRLKVSFPPRKRRLPPFRWLATTHGRNVRRMHLLRIAPFACASVALAAAACSSSSNNNTTPAATFTQVYTNVIATKCGPCHTTAGGDGVVFGMLD